MNASLMHTPIFRCLLAAGLGLAATGSACAAKSRAQDVEGAAQAAPARAEIGPNCKGDAARPAQLALQVGKSSLMRLPEAVQHRSVGNPAVVQALLVAPDTLYIAGVDVGTTNMIVQGRSGLCSVLDITVAIDPAPLQATLAAVMPEERGIKVMAAADTLILSGSVSDAGAVAQAVELAAAYVRRPVRGLAVPKPDKDKEDVEPKDGGGASTTGPRIVNLLTVNAPQQVQLEVKVAEVSKTLLERLESGGVWSFGSGNWGAVLTSNFLSGSANGSLLGFKLTGNSGKSLTAAAEKQDSLVRVLAEPNIMAISGQEGTFLAGGKFYIPVAQENNRVTLAEKEFGVGLRFTPTVLAGGRINLRVAPEVSELSREGIGISSTGIGNSVLPVVTTRRASTTVQLYDGQSFAIGGLIKNNLVSNLKGLPVLGELPVLGALFRSTDYQQDRTELVFVITAHLVKPLTGAGYALPTDKVGVPSRAAMLLGGRLDAPAPESTTAAESTPALVPRSSHSSGGFELK